MTKKHFEELADLIRDLPNNISKEQLINELAPFLQRQNPRFDTNRFCARATEALNATPPAKTAARAEAQALKKKITDEAQARGINRNAIATHLDVVVIR